MRTLTRRACLFSDTERSLKFAVWAFAAAFHGERAAGKGYEDSAAALSEVADMASEWLDTHRMDVEDESLRTRRLNLAAEVKWCFEQFGGEQAWSRRNESTTR